MQSTCGARIQAATSPLNRVMAGAGGKRHAFLAAHQTHLVLELAGRGLVRQRRLQHVTDRVISITCHESAVG